MAKASLRTASISCLAIWVTIWLLVLLGGARVVLAVATGERFDTEATLALLMFCLGVLWGMQRFRKRSGDLHDAPPTDEHDA